MLTFGGGIHYCLGAHLARIELAEALTIMARRMPDIRCNATVPWKPITGITGPVSLPVSFTTAASEVDHDTTVRPGRRSSDRRVLPTAG